TASHRARSAHWESSGGDRRKWAGWADLAGTGVVSRTAWRTASLSRGGAPGSAAAAGTARARPTRVRTELAGDDHQLDRGDRGVPSPSLPARAPPESWRNRAWAGSRARVTWFS